MLRFLFIAAQNHAISGGSELLWSRVAVALSKQGHTVFASLPAGGNFPEDAPNGVHLIQRHTKKSGLIVRLRMKLFNTSLASGLVSLKAIISEAKPDLIIINQPGFTEGLAYAEMAIKQSIPYLMIVHNIHRWAWLSPNFAERVARVYRECLRIDLLSDDAQQDLSDILNESFDRVTRFRNPYRVDYANALPFQSLDSEVQIAMVGRLDPKQKGHDLALRVLADPVWRTRPVTLNVYGDGDYRTFLQKMAERLGVGDKVLFHGHVSDVSGIWKHNHALLMPSRYEGLPIAMVEAMLCGRPVIASAVGGIPEWIQNGENGFLIPAPTVELVSATMEEAWRRRGDWNLVGECARSKALSLTNADPVAEYADSLCMLAESK